jgi:hypothetical protein
MATSGGAIASRSEETRMTVRTLVAGSLLASAAMAFAGTPGVSKSAQAPYARSTAPFAVPDPDTAEILSSTYTAVGDGKSAPLSYRDVTTIATNHVKCNHAHGCSIGIESMAQLSIFDRDWEICWVVDGAYVGCQYQGLLSGPSGFVVGNARGWVSGVSQGFHTVETQLYTDSSSATYQYFQTDVRIYKP